MGGRKAHEQGVLANLKALSILGRRGSPLFIRGSKENNRAFEVGMVAKLGGRVCNLNKKWVVANRKGSNVRGRSGRNQALGALLSELSGPALPLQVREGGVSIHLRGRSLKYSTLLGGLFSSFGVPGKGYEKGLANYAPSGGSLGALGV